ncbi:MAG TPA: Asp-tRNA(Asn)/Glu-tRNA(Gln) amidotransferase subunit GatC [Labilithrix sp.]|jgi:aspartyl-tRNA(Asn)/glutamyl-tRNA(Gln) amidotransferase subunit C|nr:Asp-tRNA(Asn)/Glu-tRNA(Gln) amidotransferase subunit GatC [Labilithrix sp.]
MENDHDLERLRHVANLSELSLSADEEKRFAGELGRIVALFAELDAIDTAAVPATAQVAGIEPVRSEEGWREDVVRPGLEHDEALAAAPRVDHGGFAVPTFVE